LKNLQSEGELVKHHHIGYNFFYEARRIVQNEELPNMLSHMTDIINAMTMGKLWLVVGADLF
jgi:hypothetical protein